MRYVVNGMTLADIPRVIEIEKLAYSSTWPASSYRKELQDNPLAHYIVERDTQMPIQVGSDSPSDSGRRPFPLSLLARPQPQQPLEITNIVGFAGLWLMVDEAHITTIATHPDYRGRGLGELMLTSLIGIAYDIGARQVTLEVRVTNSVAQNLYHKYGFASRASAAAITATMDEDALIMWTAGSSCANISRALSPSCTRCSRRAGRRGASHNVTEPPAAPRQRRSASRRQYQTITREAGTSIHMRILGNRKLVRRDRRRGRRGWPHHPLQCRRLAGQHPRALRRRRAGGRLAPSADARFPVLEAALR